MSRRTVRSDRAAGRRSREDDRPACAHEGQGLLDSEEGSLHVDVERIVEVSLGYLGERTKLAQPGVGEQDVDVAFSLLDRRKDAIKIVEL